MKNRLLWFAPAILALCAFVEIGRGSEALIAEDAYISAARPAKKFGAAPILTVGRDERTLLRFDLSALPSGTTGTQIAKATLQMWQASATRGGSVNLFPVESAWSEIGVTDATSPTIGATAAGSLDVVAGRSKIFVSADLTALVRQWVDGTHANLGVAMVPMVAGAVATFDAKESTATSHEPRLEISIASQGPPGKDGTDGMNGKDGVDGKNGIDGKDGLKGDKGDKGDPGAPAVLPSGLTQAFPDDGSAPPVGYSDFGIRSANWSVQRAVNDTPISLTRFLVTGGNLYGVAAEQAVARLDLGAGPWGPAIYLTPNMQGAALAGAADGFIYSFGGNMISSPYTLTANASRIDPTTGNSSPLTPMPIANSTAAAAILNGYAYVFGGITTDVYALNLASGQWQQLTSVPAGLSLRTESITVVGNGIFFSTNLGLYSFTPNTNSWQFEAELPFGIATILLPMGDSAVLLYGGGGSADGRTYRYDLQSGDLRQAATLPVPSANSIAGVVGGELIVFRQNPSGLIVRAPLDSFKRLFIRN